MPGKSGQERRKLAGLTSFPHWVEGEITRDPFTQLCSADALGNFP